METIIPFALFASGLTVGGILSLLIYRRQFRGARAELVRCRAVVDNSANGVTIFRAVNGGEDFVIVKMNNAATRIHNLSSESVRGRLATEVFPEMQRNGLFYLLQRVYQTGKSDQQRIGLYHEERLFGWRENFVYKLPSHEVVVVFRDEIPSNQSDVEKRKMHAQLLQAQKMESLGTMAGGIAHNFNNTMMGILGSISLLLEDKDASHSDYQELKEMERYAKNAGDMTKDLLSFARGGKYVVNTTDLNDMIKRENRIFGQTKKEIRFQGRYAGDLWTVEVDQGQIRQVLMNLYLNASQAMPEGGEITVKTDNVVIAEEYANAKPFEISQGKYVRITVADTGKGMHKSTMEKIFEPFFTTKDIGEGTGLGLSSVYGIVKNHGGFINVYSEVEKGTTFTIYLPAMDKKLEDQPAHDNAELLKGTETILLVDDEELIRNVGERMLRRLGYTVISVESGGDAVETYEKNMGMIDMVVLDMIMPDMSGGETYEHLRMINPDIKVLLSSGYSLNEQAERILAQGCNGFTQKPFTMEEISRKIRDVLDQK
ncbi:MAG: ATP-binding protein [Thermodesulfobacteriota bacterium]|nr:ATP-binding protein [Thermodesulfobacteriota bacterium]